MNTPWPYPKLFAHRGGGALAPENTLAGMRMAATQKYQAVEFDVKLAACGTLIVMHDDTLDRTTNGNGLVADTRYEDIAKLDAGSWQAEKFAGERVPTFVALAELCIDLGLLCNVEIKPNAGQAHETGAAVALACKKIWADKKYLPLLTSFSYDALAAAQAAAAEFPRGILYEQLPAEWKIQAKELDCASVNCHHAQVSVDQIQTIRAAGYRMICYTVNEVAKARKLFAWGVDGIFTDNLVEMKSLKI
ncbi:MAG: ugpQ [Pseudomonadota bacterium]|jgi:glycerophosphoryl diester phosphodiesterase